MKKLTAENVTQTMMNCLFHDGEDHTNFVKAEGITRNFGFHPDRLEESKQDIIDYLTQLPANFRKSGGGGWSFLQACMTEDGRHWGEHHNMEDLFALGCAIGKCHCLVPRDMWHILPGGVPYYVIDM